ncbi:MAG: hypothetical protein ACE5GX_01885 [Thermoanaerobaculia bacterium]
MQTPRASIERVRYWQGQTLRSSDLNDQLAHDTSLRWWHNRSIHNTYGIVGGFRSGLDADRVIVGAGLAYDCFGRELLSLEPRSLGLPPDDPEKPGVVWHLVARAASNRLLTPTPLEFVWLPATVTERPDQGVTIAIGSWSDGQLRLDRRRQHPIRPVARPRLANGETVHGKTDWRLWTVLAGTFGRRTASGVEVTINTSAAGFQRTPCYFASLRGDPWIRIGDSSVLVGFDRVVEATPRSFVFSLWILPLIAPVATPSVAVSPLPLEQLARRKWSVCWLGIESSRALFTEVRKR